MFAEFRHTLRRLQGQMIGWSIGLVVYGVLMASLYSSMAEMIDVEALLQNYPPQMVEFFGTLDQINTPQGYLDTYFFGYMPVIVGIFSVGVGAGLLVSHEEQGILDLILAHPISRSELLWGRLLGLAAATSVIMLASWLSWAVPSQSVGIDLSWLQLLQPFVPLLAVLLLFGALALLLSLLLPATRLASLLSGALLIGNYLLLGLSNINAELKAMVRYTPLYYFQAGDALGGLRWDWLAGLLGVTLLIAVVSWLLFQRRDIRVGGERSWQLPGWSRLRRRGRSLA